MFVGTAAFSASAGAAGNEVTYSGGKKIVISQRIADKIAAKQALNFVISYPYITIAGASAQMYFHQTLETADIYHLADQVVTLSAYVASSGPTSDVVMGLEYSTSVDNAATGSWTSITTAQQAFTSSMAQISLTAVVPSTAKSLRVIFYNNTAFASGQSFYVGNVQLERGSYVSAWNRMGKTLADELALCQRYYFRIFPAATNKRFTTGQVTTTASATFNINFPVTMRTSPAAIEQSGSGTNYAIINAAGSTVAGSGVPTFVIATPLSATFTVASTYTAAGQATQLLSNGTTAYLGFSADL
jgi:hypothetical protein